LTGRQFHALRAVGVFEDEFAERGHAAIIEGLHAIQTIGEVLAVQRNAIGAEFVGDENVQ
jgi:hypothetical protein